SGVRAVPLAVKEGEKFAPADAEHALDGSYPLARTLFVYINKHPNRKLDPLQAEFLKMVLSKQGQEVVVRDGYIPLPAAVAAKAMKDLQLSYQKHVSKTSVLYRRFFLQTHVSC